jgi:surfactin synthase thioesterase subunit
MAALVSAVRGEVDAIARSGRLYVLYGHSLGSLVACALAHVLQAAGRGPTALVVSGRNGPSRPSEAPPVHRGPDAALVALLRSLGGTPPAFIDDPDLRRLILAPLRADLTVAETYEHDPPTRLRCPILSLQGEQDPVVSRDGASAWIAETEGPCEVAWLPGGHFFLQEPGAVAVTLRGRVADVAARQPVNASGAGDRLAA